MANHTLETFKSRIRQVGLPTASHYYVEISGAGQNISMMVDSCSIPGLNIMTTEMRTFGEISEIPYGISYTAISMSIILDNKSLAKEFFDNWTNDVFDRSARVVNYYKEYIKDVKIILTDKKSNPIYTVYLREAYPKGIGDIQLDYTNHDVIRLSVTLNFKYWEKESGGQLSPLQLARAKQNISGSRIDTLSTSSFGTSSGSNTLREFGDYRNIGASLSTFGPDMGNSCARSATSVEKSLLGSTMSGAGSLTGSFNNLSSNFVNLGSSIGDLGKNLNQITAPVSAMVGAVGSISNTLGTIDTTLNAIGLGSPFSKIRSNLISTAGKLNTVSNLGGVPRNLGSIGASMTAMGSQFKVVSDSIKTIPGSTSALSGSLNKLGFNLTKQGDNVSNSATVLNTYHENNQ